MSYNNCIVLTAPRTWMLVTICKHLVGGPYSTNINKLKKQFIDNDLKISCELHNPTMMCIKISTQNLLNITVFINTVMSMMHNSICTFQKSINNGSITTIYRYNDERIEHVFINGKCEYNKIIKDVKKMNKFIDITLDELVAQKLFTQKKFAELKNA